MSDRHERFRRRVRLGVAGVLTIVLLAVAHRGHAHWRIAHLEQQAAAFQGRHDYPSTVLVCRRLLQLNPNDAAACRLMGETAHLAGSPETVAWYQRLLALEPSTANLLALTTTALSHGQPRLAESVLAAVPAPERETARFHEIAGALAISQKNTTVAQEHFRRAAEINPNDARAKLNFASVELMLGGEKAEAARAALAQLTTEATTRLPALRALLGDAVARHDPVAQTHWADKLHAAPGAAFADQLLCLESAAQGDSEASLLSQLENAARNSPIETAAIISWMNRHHRAEAALTWANSLARKIADAQPVPLAVAESYSCAQDWSGLSEFVRHASWGDCESLRLAVESHALRRLAAGSDRTLEFEIAWHSALKLAQARPEQLAAIAQLARGWGYTAEAEEAWWMIASGGGDTQQALEALYRSYKADQNTRGLLKVSKRALELNPADLVAANNCASLGLLLGEDANAQRLAEKLHREHPTNAAFTATYAFALHTEGKTAEAVQLLASLNDAQLRTPEIAAYYLVLLVQNGEMDRAMSFLPAAKRATLLPEEQQLVAKATRELLERARAEALAQS